MDEYSADQSLQQRSLFGDETSRLLLDQLLYDSRLYRQSKDFKELLDFVVRLRNFAPFNAMLLQIQKPGLSYAASAYDWWERFDRRPKAGARPLLILWPFGPVAFVYDVIDTEGKSLPEDVACFSAHGVMDVQRMDSFREMLSKKSINLNWVDAGDRSAGQIQVVTKATADDSYTTYEIQINRNHTAPVQFATLAHELGHLYLGHLGDDKRLKVRERVIQDYSQRELEAECAAYIVCHRIGVQPKSESHLSSFVDNKTTVDDLDIYQILLAAGHVETLLGLHAHTGMPKPGSTRTKHSSLFPEE